MNKVILTHDRIFMSVVGPSGSGKTELIFKMLKGSTFYPKFEKFFLLLQRASTSVLYNSKRDKRYRVFEILGI